MLEDGTYDALVIDAEPVGDAPDEVHLELTITAGEHKGEVVAVRGPRSDRDEVELLGLPATLVVRDGTIRVRIDD